MLAAPMLSIYEVPFSNLLLASAGGLVIFDSRRFPYIGFLYFLSYVKMGVSELTLPSLLSLAASNEPQCVHQQQKCIC